VDYNGNYVRFYIIVSLCWLELGSASEILMEPFDCGLSEYHPAVPSPLTAHQLYTGSVLKVHIMPDVLTTTTLLFCVVMRPATEFQSIWVVHMV